ncbi:MAG: CvpA family protein [Candidatus Omnitrophica bacterium]|nr:CvpA family protein [Candidatus Omnitrophota bacterium]
MLLNILKQINWLDIFVLVLMARICYIAVKSGFPVELFKFVGTLSALYLALHYYTVLSGYIINQVSFLDKLPGEFLQFIVFLALVTGGYSLFILLRSIFYRFLKMEAVSTLNKWGSLILGIARGVLLASLIMFMFTVSSVGYFKNSVRASYLSSRLFSVAPDTYSWIWNSITSKFALSEKYNPTVTLTTEEFFKK